MRTKFPALKSSYPSLMALTALLNIIILVVFVNSTEVSSLRGIDVVVILILLPFILYPFIYTSSYTYKLSVHNGFIEAYHKNFLWMTKKTFKVSKEEIKSFSVIRNTMVGDKIKICLKNGDDLYIATRGMNLAEVKGLDKPKFNSDMSEQLEKQIPFIIAYNLSELFNVPFESEYIN